MVFEVHPANWHISQFGKGGFMRLWDTVFESTTEKSLGIVLAARRAGSEVLKFGCGGSSRSLGEGC